MSASPIELERRARFEFMRLRAGKHPCSDDGMCAIEAYHWLMAEPHTDDYASKVIGAFMCAWNDGLQNDEARDILKPLVIALVEANRSLDVSDEADLARGLMVADWYCRHWTPTWLDLGGLANHATALRTFRPLLSWDDVAAIEPLLSAARSAAGRGPWSVARSAAGSAAWSAAGFAARSAAWFAAGSAAEEAAWEAACDALAPTVAALQTSAADLVMRLVAVRGAP